MNYSPNGAKSNIPETLSNILAQYTSMCKDFPITAYVRLGILAILKYLVYADLEATSVVAKVLADSFKNTVSDKDLESITTFFNFLISLLIEGVFGM